MRLVRKWLYHSRPSNWWFPRQNCGGITTKFLLLQIDPIPKLVRYARIPAKIGNVKTSLKIKISIIQESLPWQFCCQSPKVILAFPTGKRNLRKLIKTTHIGIGPKNKEPNGEYPDATQCISAPLESKNGDNGRIRKVFLRISFNFHRQTEDSVANGIDVNLDLIHAKRENFRPGSNNRGPFPHVTSGIFLLKTTFNQNANTPNPFRKLCASCSYLIHMIILLPGYLLELHNYRLRCF